MSSQPSYFYRLFPQLQLIEDQLPSEIELPHTDKSIPVFTMECGSRVCYRMHQGIGREPTTIKSNFKIPKQCPIYYFEVLLDDLGSGGSVSLGLIPPSYHLSRLIGHDRGYGLTVDDGRKHFEGTSVADEARKCIRGNTVGIGVNFISRTIFFTKDGEFLGDDFKNIKGDEFYPAVSLHSPGANLIFNFGQTPFLYNLESHLYSFLSYIRVEIDEQEKNEWDREGVNDALTLIAEYASHHCMADTVQELSSLLENPVERTHEQLTIGKEIYQNLIDRDYRTVVETVASHFPNIETTHPHVYLALMCINFFYVAKRMCKQNKPEKMSIEQENKAFKDIIGLGQNIHMLFCQLMRTVNDHNKLYGDECNITHSQWHYYIKVVVYLVEFKDLLTLMSCDDTAFFDEHEKHFDLRPKFLTGLSLVVNGIYS